jgi:hypothetical protein
VLQQIAFHIQDAVLTVVLWRGTAPVQIRGHKFKVPVHSITAFLLSVILVEHPHFLPSFALFAVAWLLLAIMGYRRSSPDVWSRCKSFTELADCLIVGESRAPPDSIAPYTNSDEANAYHLQWQQRLVDAEEAASRAYDDTTIEPDDDTSLHAEHASDALVSPRRGVSLDPFRKHHFVYWKSLDYKLLTLSPSCPFGTF